MANGLSGPVVLSDIDLYGTSATAPAGLKLGALALDQFGNRYRLSKNAGTALATAKHLQESAEDAQFVSMAVPAAVAIGQTQITVTNGTTTVTANMFKDGFLTISTSTGIG